MNEKQGGVHVVCKKSPVLCCGAKGGAWAAFELVYVALRAVKAARVCCRYATVSFPSSSRRLMAFTKSRVPTKTSCV